MGPAPTDGIPADLGWLLRMRMVSRLLFSGLCSLESYSFFRPFSKDPPNKTLVVGKFILLPVSLFSSLPTGCLHFHVLA